MDASQEIWSIIDRRIAAMRDKDAVAAIGLLAADIVAFEMVPPLAIAGKAVRDRDAMEGWFASWDGPIEIEIRDPVIHVDGCIGFSHSLNRLKGTRVDGSVTDLWMRSTLGFARIDGSWRIVHAHTSLPFNPSDGFRAATDLRP